MQPSADIGISLYDTLSRLETYKQSELASLVQDKSQVIIKCNLTYIIHIEWKIVINILLKSYLISTHIYFRIWLCYRTSLPLQKHKSKSLKNLILFYKHPSVLYWLIWNFLNYNISSDVLINHINLSVDSFIISWS